MRAVLEAARVAGRQPAPASVPKQQLRGCDWAASVALSLKWDLGIELVGCYRNDKIYVERLLQFLVQMELLLSQYNRKKQKQGIRLNGEWFFYLLGPSAIKRCDLIVWSNSRKYMKSYQPASPPILSDDTKIHRALRTLLFTGRWVP